jgi:hypothetical protein
MHEDEMSKLRAFQARARALARSGSFYGLLPLEFELRFEDGFEQARDWLADGDVREELDHMCREARQRGLARKNAA